MATAKKASASRKTTRRAAPATAADTAVSAKVKPAPGKRVAGKAWDPSSPLPAKVEAMKEAQDPRPPTKSRYPISNEAFEALKAEAPKARIPAKDAVLAKDTKTRPEVAATAVAAAALAPGLAPTAAPAASANFAGMTATGWIPPDCTIAVGPEHVLEAVNSSLAIYGKGGGGPLLQRTLTVWFANIVSGMTIFDPKALYDQHAGRWVLLAVATRKNTTESLFLLSVSSSADPMKPWRNYKLDATLDGTTKTNNWADFPALGVDNQALYVTANMFAFGAGTFQYAKLRVIPKAGPYAGAAAAFVDFTRMRNADNTTVFTLQPCHTFGAPQVEYLVNSGFPSGNFLSVWRVVNPTASPSLTRTQVKVSPYSLAPNADQKNGGAPLNTGDVRVLQAVFRGDSIWTAFTTAHNWGTGPNRAAVQWCQVRAAVPALVQEGIFGAARFHYFYPASCPDNNGNMTIVMSRCGPSEFGSIVFTGRRSIDPPGSLQASTMLKAGVANYVALDSGGRNRWGDYNGVASDPANARVVWFCSEFASAPNTWATWIGSSFF